MHKRGFFFGSPFMLFGQTSIDIRNPISYSFYLLMRRYLHGAGLEGGESLQVVIIGNGVAGITAAFELRKRKPDWKITIVSGVVSKDHVHLLAICPPQLSPSQVMKWVKGRSSRKLQMEYPHLRKRYWGQHLWARGYFCASTGSVTEELIREYVEQHGKPPSDFKVEEPR